MCGVVLMQLQSCRTALIARVVVDVCCHCLCVIPLVESFLGDRLAHRDAASNALERKRSRQRVHGPAWETWGSMDHWGRASDRSTGGDASKLALGFFLRDGS